MVLSMRRSPWPLLGLALLVLGVAAGLGWQRWSGALLREEAEALRAQNAELTRLRAEHQRLVAQQVPPEQVAALREDRAALVRLDREVEALRVQAEKKPTAPPAPAVSKLTPLAPPAITDGPLPASEWKNAGQATPVATLETALWAAGGGNMEALAQTILLEGAARTKAEALFATLPPADQAKYGSPAQLVALLTAKDVPLGTAKINELKPRNDEEKAAWRGDAKVTATLTDANGRSPKFIWLTARNDGGTWRLVVPEKTVDKYVELLKGAVPAAR